MSPEQCRGASSVDHRTDVYSLGCIMFEMLAGRRPYIYEGFGELIAAHLTEAPPSFESLGVEMAPDVEAWMRRLLAKAPNDRVSSMAEVSAGVRGLRHRTTAVMPSFAAAAAAPGGAAPAKTPSAGGTMRLPDAAPARPASTPAMTTLSSQAAEHLAPAASPKGKWALAGIGAAVVVVGGALLISRSHSGPAADPPAPAAASAAHGAVTPAEPEPVTITVNDPPKGLRAWVDGEPAALPLHLPAGDREHDVLFQAPGLGNVKMKLDGSKSRTVTVPFAAPTAPLVDTPAKTAGDGHAQPPASKSDRGEEHKHHTRHGSGGLSDDARKL
jgi:hypothetical protein